MSCRLPMFAGVVTCVVIGVFAIIGGVTLIDRSERWHCARYLVQP